MKSKSKRVCILFQPVLVFYYRRVNNPEFTWSMDLFHTVFFAAPAKFLIPNEN